jgi:hypothetical protein
VHKCPTLTLLGRYSSNEYGSERRGYGTNDAGLHTEAGRNAQGHFNSAAEGVGRAAAEFDQGGGREAFESVGNPIANRNEGQGEHVNPFLKPAQELAAATLEGAKGLPGAILVSSMFCSSRLASSEGGSGRNLLLASMRRTRCTLKAAGLARPRMRTGETSTER